MAISTAKHTTEFTYREITLQDRLREVAGDGWLVIDAPIGTHDRAAVGAALDGLARDGLIELDRQGSLDGQRARLPVG